MAAEAARDCSDEERRLLAWFLDFDPPEGFRAELIEGEVVVSPAPAPRHEKCLSRLSRQVARMSVTPMDYSGNAGLVLQSGGRCTKNYAIPDGVFAPIDLDLFDPEENWISPDGVAMVVEVTSGRADHDRTVKRYCYAKAALPHYMLVDRQEKSVTLFSDPDEQKQDYLEISQVPFGKPLLLPELFGFQLETVDFV
ncbi:Uma2 family endonuclease [Actinomadura harenae]|uniref:Uma2 family endonuclease n=1 Tax=Actinomadura harenae TaxID=2483351 RepID=A0A3M2LM25_9ACTN|nr:Uma2 family endonuclease [Actinomadura harenae]RMI37593.1 Uma2 family endonuclease [Actinomadura harenae]